MLISFGYDNPIDIEILGYDFKAGQKLADQVAAIVRQTPGARDVRDQPGAGLSPAEYRYRPGAGLPSRD